MKEIMIKDLQRGTYEHEFNISELNELWTSDDKLWTTSARNRKIASVDDNGNGYEFTFHDSGNSIKLGYAEALHLYILFSDIVDVKVDFVEKTIVKSI
jgi:hypothetical protein